MQILVLVAFLVGLTVSREDVLAAVAGGAPGRAWLSPWWAVAAWAAYLAGTALLAHVHVRRAVRGECPVGGRLRRKLAGLAARGRHLWLIAGLAGVIVCGWGRWIANDLGLQNVPLAGKAMAMAPFFVALVLAWLVEYPLYRHIRRRISAEEQLRGALPAPMWSRGEYLIYNVRHHLLFIAVPVMAILLVTDALQLYVAPVLPESWRAEAMLALMLTSAGGVFLVAPVALVRIWRTSSLPAGATRDELEEMRDSLGLRWRDLRVWHSGGTIANAGVMGLIAPLRYVLLSDVLLDRMDAHHVAAIFAHEAGHVVHKHILYAAMFAVGSVLLCGAAGEGLIVWLDWPAWAGEALVLSMLAVVWGVAFGWLSRRFERQSDVLAAWAAGGSDPQGRITYDGALVFAEALQRVGQLNGIAPDQWNWRHGSIAQRIQHILGLADAQGDRHTVDRGVRRIKCVLWVTLLVAVGVTVWQVWAWS